MESIDLGATLGKAVKVTPITVIDPDTDNFEMDEEIIQEPEVILDKNDPAPEPEHGYMPPNHIAEMIVNLFDGLQSSALPLLRQMTIFTAKEREVLQTLDTTGNTIYPTNSPENSVLIKWRRHEEVIKGIPFNEGEKNRLITATARYAETTEMKITPLQGLMMSWGEVVFTRGKMVMTG